MPAGLGQLKLGLGLGAASVDAHDRLDAPDIIVLNDVEMDTAVAHPLFDVVLSWNVRFHLRL